MFVTILFLFALVLLFIGAKFMLDYIDQNIDPELANLRKAAENVSIKTENEAVKPEMFNEHSDAPPSEEPTIDQKDEGESVWELFFASLSVAYYVFNAVLLFIMFWIVIHGSNRAAVTVLLLWFGFNLFAILRQFNETWLKSIEQNKR